MQPPDHLIEQLEQEPFAFDFFRAVRLLQARYPDLPGIGYSDSPARDPIRFAQNPSLAFAPSTLEELRRMVRIRFVHPDQETSREKRLQLEAEWLKPVKRKFRVMGSPDDSYEVAKAGLKILDQRGIRYAVVAAAGSAPKLFVNHFGLFGPNGPMPLHFTEYAYERQLHDHDYTLGAFLNIFHHRFLCFFFRAWADSQKALDLDRPSNERFSVFLGSFFGLGTEAMRGRDEVQDWAKLYFTGQMSNQTRHAEGLESILREYFAIKTELQTFVGRWMALPADSVCQLGASEDTGRLGLTTILGSRIWEAQLNFRVRMGPMGLKDFERLLPDGIAFKRLKRWVLNYCGEHFFWDIQFILLAAEVPETCLGRSGRLGWTTWLKTKPFTRDAEDLVLNPPLG